MPRRAVGIVLLAIVVIAAVVSARIGGVRVAGEAVAPPRLGAPAVGDCISDVTGPVSVGLPTNSIVLSTVSEKGLRFVDCSAAHAGEIVGYRSISADTQGEYSTDEWCRTMSAGYGANAVRHLGDVGDDGWTPTIGPRFLVILGALPGATSFHWAACAVTSPGFEPYRGSFTGSVAQGAPPAPFGVCRQTTDSSAWASCTSPHRTQEFGTTTSTLTKENLGSCADLITRMTGMTDITADGLLQLDLVETDRPSALHADVLAPVTASCRLTIVGIHSLNGTLLGLDDRPLPLA
jgi:hypothetical protein